MDVRASVRHRLGPYRVAKVKRTIAPLLRRDLTRLGRLYGTNKVSAKQLSTPLYARHLRDRRREPLCVLEIGIGGYQTGTGGSSLRMWRTYFPKARVYGIDIEPRDLREPRIETFCGSQADPGFLRSVVDRTGSPDLIVDDGSHRSEDVVASFEVLFPLLARGGIYVIEDAHRSYIPTYGGGPPGTEGTTVEFVKGRIDELVRRLPGSPEPAVEAIHIYPRIIFVEKTR
jgi:demethylmacrocin O-methyltransferase